MGCWPRPPTTAGSATPPRPPLPLVERRNPHAQTNGGIIAQTSECIQHAAMVQESRTRGLLLQEVRASIHRSMSADNQALIRGHRQAASHRRSTLKNPDSCRCNCRNSAPAGNLEASALVKALAFGIRSAAASEQRVPRPRSSSSSLKTKMDPGKGA